MLALSLETPNDIILQIAQNVKEKRLLKNWTQQALANRSGVSLGAIKIFERTGKISLKSLTYIAFSLGCLDELANLFKAPNVPLSLFVDEKQKRQRGRKL